MKKIVDATGLACPEPVILTKKAFDENSELEVIVSNSTSLENVSRFAKSKNASIKVEDKGNDIYHISITKENSATTEQTNTTNVINKNKTLSGPLVIAISSEIMGRDNKELGSILIKGFIHTLQEVDNIPETILFFNEGVKLTVKGSEVLDDLKYLENKGITILVCGTCLDFFDLTDKIKVGLVSNMYDIAQAMTSAGNLVTF